MSEFTLGGYMQKHDRAAAFGGSDGQAYSVAIYVDEEPDVRGLYGAALLFVRWSPGGDRPSGHVETETLVWGKTPAEARVSAGVPFAVRREGRARRSYRPRARESGDSTARHGAGAGWLGLSGGDGDGEVRAVLRGKAKRDTPAGGGGRPRAARAGAHR